MDRPTILQSRQIAPEFRLRTTPDQFVSLSEFRGQPAVLIFYPADWSPVCGDELALFNEVLPEIRKYGGTVLAISVDNVWSHLAYAHQKNLHFPLFSDFEPKGEVARSYGVYECKEGVCCRALFVIDANGIIYWSYLSPIGINPGVDGVLDALESLSKGKLNQPAEQAL